MFLWGLHVHTIFARGTPTMVLDQGARKTITVIPLNIRTEKK